MKCGIRIALVVVFTSIGLNSLHADDRPEPKPTQDNEQLVSAVKSLSEGVVLLTDEIRALQRDNQQLHTELTEIKTRIEKTQPTNRDASPSADSVAEQAKVTHDDTIASFNRSLLELRTERLQIFSNIVGVEVAAIEHEEWLKLCESGLAKNLNIEDEKIRTTRAARLHEDYKLTQEAYQQLKARIEALNAELTIVNKKIEHLQKRFDEAKELTNLPE